MPPDVLRDEGEAYARKLWEAGVRVTYTRYIGTIHDFVMLNAIADTPAARRVSIGKKFRLPAEVCEKMRRDGGSVFPAHANTGDPNGPLEAFPLMSSPAR